MHENTLRHLGRLARSALATLALAGAALALAQQTDDRSMQGVAAVSEGARVSLRWYLPGDVFPEGGFVVVRTAADGSETSWEVPSPLPPERSLVDPRTYQAALSLYAPGAMPAGDDTAGFEFARALFTVRAALDPDLSETLGILLHDDDVEVGQRLQYEVLTADGRPVGSAAITVGSTPPLGAPTGLRADVQDGTVGLLWDRPAESELVVAYQAEVLGPGGVFTPLADEWTPLPTADEDAPFWIADGSRLPGEEVTYRVVGRDLFGRRTPPSEPVTVRVPVALALPQPQVTNAEVGDRTITLHWAIEPSGDVAGFMVLRAASGEADPEPVSPLLPPQVTAWTDEGLRGGTDYYYYVAAFAADGTGVVGPVWVQRAVNPNPPGAPTGLSVEPREASLVVSWQSPADDDVGRYQVFAGRPGTPFESLTLVGETVATTLEVPVPANTLFDVAVRVRAVNTSDVAGEPSAEATGRVVDLTPPSAPLWADVTGGEKVVTLAWLRDLDADVAAVRVLRSPAGQDAFEALTDWLAPSVTRFDDATAVPGLSYDYALQAVDAAGNESELSEARTAAAWSLDAPAPVTGLAAEVLEEGGVRLTWDAGEPGTGWVVSRRMGAAFVEVSGLLDAPGFVDPRGRPGDAYRVVSVSATRQVGAPVDVTVAAP
ncbi:MAG TPA: hypothetical protein VFF08_08195 [Trueperaceae bacterium]|nr:hypothetical protein [Trueperaceae bacterium]